MSTIQTPTKSNLAFAAAKIVQAGLAAAAQAGAAASFSDIAAVAADLTTDLTGDNNDLVFTAKSAGAAGNTISVTYVDPGAETAEESVRVAGNDIQVTLRSVSGTLSTAAEVTTAIEASAAADALVGVANAAANTGAGEVIAMAKAYLTGGIDAVTADEQLADAMGESAGNATMLMHASELSLPYAMQVLNALDGAGVTAFKSEVADALDAVVA